MAEAIERVRLFIPGTPASTEAWSKALDRGGLRIERGALCGDVLDAKVQVEWVENDGTFGEAFSFGTVAPAMIAALDEAPGGLVLQCQVDLREGRRQIVAVVERLRDAGALAVRIEQSHLGWEVSRWIELFSSDDAWSWHKGEDPMILSGQTFAPDPETPRRRVERWPDTQYPPRHSCHNPYGVWRLGRPGGSGRSMGKLLPVFTPALHVLLAALEEKGKPLTRQQVESTRDQGACIAMEPRDAQKLERARGYSDLDPALVWEQWQIVRKSTG